LGQALKNGPNEAAEFPGNGGDDDVSMFALIETPKFLGQTMLSLDRDGDDVGRLSLAPAVKNGFGPCTVAVVPSGFDEDSAGVTIAGFGDGSTVFAFAGGSLRGNKAEVGHESLGRAEAPDVVDFEQKCKSGKDLDPTQAHESFDLNAVQLGLGEEFELSVESAELGLEIFKVLQVDAESGLERAFERVAEVGEPPAVSFGPSGLAFAEDVTVVA
jgi:hypothetical protein